MIMCRACIRFVIGRQENDVISRYEQLIVSFQLSSRSGIFSFEKANSCMRVSSDGCAASEHMKCFCFKLLPFKSNIMSLI